MYTNNGPDDLDLAGGLLPATSVLVEDGPPRSACHTWTRRLVKAVVVALLLALVAVVGFYPHKADKLTELLLWVQLRPVAGFMTFLLLYIVCTVAFVPVTLLAVAAGAVFGLWVGAALVWLGALVGETLAFLIGRFLLRGWVKKTARQHQVWRALEAALKEEGWKVVLLLRMAPILPFALLNYAMGSSAVKFTSFFAASSLGVVPGITMHVYLGTLVKDISSIHSASSAPQRARLVVLIVSLVSCVVALVASTLVARHALLTRLRALEESDLSQQLLGSDQVTTCDCRTSLDLAGQGDPEWGIPPLSRLWPFQLRRIKSLGGETASGGCLADMEPSCGVVVAAEDERHGDGHVLGVLGQGRVGNGADRGCSSRALLQAGGDSHSHGGQGHASGGLPCPSSSSGYVGQEAVERRPGGAGGWVGPGVGSQLTFTRQRWWPGQPAVASDRDAEEFTLLHVGSATNVPGGPPRQQGHIQQDRAGHQEGVTGSSSIARRKVMAISGAGGKHPGAWAAGTGSSTSSVGSVLAGSGSWPPPARELLLARESCAALPPAGPQSP